MTDEKFETNLLRVVAAELYLSLGLQVAREMYGKSYFALGIGEKAAVDQTVFAQVGANYQAMTPEFLKNQGVKQPVGFQVQTPTQTSTAASS
jgi:hypothetical protein